MNPASPSNPAPPSHTRVPENRPRRFGALALSAIALLLLAVGFGAARSYRDLSAARARIDSLNRQIGDAEEQIELLQQRVQGLRDDPAVIERLAREELGLVRPGEIVVVLPEDEPR